MKKVLLALVFFVPFLTSAQSNFQKGYVITNSKDSLRGYIDYREKALNVFSFSFKKDPDAPVQNFSVENCEGYGIDGYEYFSRYTVQVSLSGINLSKLKVGADTTYKTLTVFLKILQKGKRLTLFSYRDDIKIRFYLLEQGETQPYELKRSLFLEEGSKTNIVTVNRYLGQLSVVTGKYGLSDKFDDKRLKSVSYNSSDLLKLVAGINEQQTQEPSVKSFRFFAGAAFGMTTIQYKGDNRLARRVVKNERSDGLIVTMGVDGLMNPIIGKLVYRAELALSSGKYEIISAERYHSFSQLTASFIPQVIYNLYNRRTIKVFAAAGPGFNFSRYSKDVQFRYDIATHEPVTLEEPVELQSFNFSLFGKTGVVLNKKFEVFAAYTPEASISNYNTFSVVSRRVTFGFNYLFSNH